MKTLLFVDDDDSVRRTFAAVLSAEGFSVETARSFAQARARLATGDVPALVVIDHQLGDGFGTDLIPLVRERSPASRVVLLSGGDEALARLHGADAGFGKGDDFDELVALLQRLAGSEDAGK